jgi:hypothetical protein
MAKDTIFFIAGSTPNEAEKAAIEKLGVKRIRNASLISPNTALESCTSVAGKVPEQYKKAKGVEVLKVVKPKSKSDGSLD